MRGQAGSGLMLGFCSKILRLHAKGCSGGGGIIGLLLGCTGDLGFRFLDWIHKDICRGF